MTRARADALTVLSTTMFVTERRHLADTGGKEPAAGGVPAGSLVDAAGLWPMERTLLICFAVPLLTWTDSQEAPSPPTCPSSKPTSSRLVINPRPQRPWPNHPAIGAVAGG